MPIASIPAIMAAGRAKLRESQMSHPNPLADAMTSAATNSVHDSAIATRADATIDGAADGSNTVRSTVQRDFS